MNSRRRYSEVRRTPHHAARANEERLRTLVSNPEPRRDRVRDVAVGLHRHHGVARIQLPAIQMRDELIERLRTDATREAVFEKEQRPLIRGGESAVEVVYS